MSKKYTFMISADWHLGAVNPEVFYNELIKMVTKVLDKVGHLDFFIVAGDIFDMKEYLSSDTVKGFFHILSSLLFLTDKYDTRFRFINGTRTHDARQLETLEAICVDFYDAHRIRFIHEVEAEYFDDLKILYLPEEYIANGELYYKEYFDLHFDFIFGHGPTDLMWYMNVEDDTEQNRSSAVVHKVEQLCKVANYSYFGHFHYNIETGPNKRFKSIGPVSRWEFDKDGRCGIYYVEYDAKTEIAKEKYIQNLIAPRLPTVEFDINQDYELEDLSRKIKELLKTVENFATRTRLIVTIDSSLKNFIIMRDFILSAFGNIPNVKLLVKNIDLTSNSKENKIEKKNNSIEENPYLYDKSMRDEDKIAAFIRKKVGSNIPLETILEVINPKENNVNNQE